MVNDLQYAKAQLVFWSAAVKTLVRNDANTVNNPEWKRITSIYDHWRNTVQAIQANERKLP